MNRHAAAVGAFVLGGVLLFGVGLFLIGDRRMLFDRSIEIYTEFANIAGLEDGGKVRVGGMDAGEVASIQVPASPSARFRVKLRVREDFHQLLRVDSLATIQTDGLVGNKFIQIEPGTDQAQVVPALGTIPSREAFELSEMLQRMSDTVDLIRTTIVDLKSGIDGALASVTDTANEAQDLMNDIGSEAREIMASTQKVSSNLNAIVAGLRDGKGTVGKLLTDESMYTSVKKISADAAQAVASLREASEQAKAAVADLRGENGPLKGVSGDFQQTLASARDAMQDLEENTEALKHNFLFRGYFNRRGYFDLDELSVEQYRQGALETRERRALRIWVRAAVLFETDANGNERLTADGQARLDSAMSQFVRYPRNSPFVIEGYAQGPTNNERFLTSRRRCQLVRDYLVAKFALDPAYVASMPMGQESSDSPDGNRWDGVALALFVPTSAM
ncbi:MAG TPA: MlaD family protein [Vicinamibacterales bacterium]|nr:MlaD family protein [Vicinamibacterales bacterium]